MKVSSASRVRHVNANRAQERRHLQAVQYLVNRLEQAKRDGEREMHRRIVAEMGRTESVRTFLDMVERYVPRRRRAEAIKSFEIHMANYDEAQSERIQKLEGRR